MILDVELEQNSYILKISKKFFQNISFPLELFQGGIPLMNEYAYLGVFQINGATFGFDGCFEKLREDDEYVLYAFNFPEPLNYLAIRRMMLTIYLSTHYAMGQMYHHQEFLAEKVWDDQALSFVMFNGGDLLNRYAIGGKLYPWFKKRLASLNKEDLKALNNYVALELNRVANYFFKKHDTAYQVSITNASFLFNVNLGGRHLAWSINRDIEKPEEFDSHNIDFHSDQKLCFAALIATNTWLRK